MAGFQLSINGRFWVSTEAEYIKVQDTHGDLYIFRNDVTADRWELTWFGRSAAGQCSQSADAADP